MLCRAEDSVDEEEADSEEGQLLLELLAWGSYYDVPEIVAECEIRLWRFVTCDNVCNMLQGAHLYMCVPAYAPAHTPLLQYLLCCGMLDWTLPGHISIPQPRKSKS